MTIRNRVVSIIAIVVTAGVLAKWSIVSARQQPAEPQTTGESATQLADGRWLLLGGESAKSVARRGAIADPATGAITNVDQSMTVPRAGHTATLLPDGTVLIVGGRSGSGQLAQ